MKKNYQTPQVEEIEIAVESAVLSNSSVTGASINEFGYGGEAF